MWSKPTGKMSICKTQHSNVQSVLKKRYVIFLKLNGQRAKNLTGNCLLAQTPSRFSVTFMFSETIRYFWSNGEGLKNEKTSTLWLAAALFDVWLNELCSLAGIWSSPASEASLLFLFDCITQLALFYILIVTSIGALKNNIWGKKAKCILVKAKLLDNKIFSSNKSKCVSVIKTYTRMKILMPKKKKKVAAVQIRFWKKNVPFSFLMMGKLRNFPSCLKFV